MSGQDVVGLVLGAGLAALGVAGLWVLGLRAETGERVVFASVWVVLLSLMLLLVGRYINATVPSGVLRDLLWLGVVTVIPVTVVWLIYFLPPQPPWPAKRRRAVSATSTGGAPQPQQNAQLWPQQKEQPFHTGDAPPWIEDVLAEQPEQPVRGGLVTPESQVDGGAW